MRPRVRAFTIVDVLTSIAVIGILMGILLPGLSSARETTRRVVCASNVRQQGLGLAMFADENEGKIPSSIFAPSDPNSDESRPERLMTLRTPLESGGAAWDGLGLLYDRSYLAAPGVFFCPSHSGSHSFASWASIVGTDSNPLVGNYHYRPRTPTGAAISLFMNPHASLITDGLWTADDYNHKVGSNVLRSDLAVRWYDDPRRRLQSSLSTSQSDEAAPEKVNDAWILIDGSSEGAPPPAPPH